MAGAAGVLATGDGLRVAAWLGAPAGLIRADGRPKPAYTALTALIKGEWWLRPTELRTDPTGRVTLRGFFGDYVVRAEDRTAAFGIEPGKSQVTAALG